MAGKKCVDVMLDVRPRKDSSSSLVLIGIARDLRIAMNEMTAISSDHKEIFEKTKDCKSIQSLGVAKGKLEAQLKKQNLLSSTINDAYAQLAVDAGNLYMGVVTVRREEALYKMTGSAAAFDAAEGKPAPLQWAEGLDAAADLEEITSHQQARCKGVSWKDFTRQADDLEAAADEFEIASGSIGEKCEGPPLSDVRALLLSARVCKCENVMLFHLSTEKSPDVLRDKLLGEISELKANKCKDYAKTLNGAVWCVVRKRIMR